MAANGGGEETVTKLPSRLCLLSLPTAAIVCPEGQRESILIESVQGPEQQREPRGPGPAAVGPDLKIEMGI